MRRGYSRVRGGIISRFQEKLAEHETYVREHGEDLPEVRNWRWEG